MYGLEQVVVLAGEHRTRVERVNRNEDIAGRPRGPCRLRKVTNSLLANAEHKHDNSGFGDVRPVTTPGLWTGEERLDARKFS